MNMRKLIGVFYDRWIKPLVDRQIEHHLLQCHHIYGGPADKIAIAPTAVVNNALFNVSSGCIKIEEMVSFGHNVCLLTGRHDLNKRGADRQNTWCSSGCDIIVRKGAWIASNVTIVGPADIGEDAVIAAGAVVRGTIPAAVLAAGVPAKVIKELI